MLLSSLIISMNEQNNSIEFNVLDYPVADRVKTHSLVVYFDYHLDAAHSKHLSKHFFQVFGAQKLEKARNLAQYLAKIETR